MKYKIPVSWKEYGEFEVDADSLEEVIEKVEGNENDEYPIGKANGEYMDDSFKVDMDCVYDLNGVDKP